ncbi:hypothetical protein JCM9140_2329 [Halalkalibacter wakoensis JCM 9140]|uniref:Lipoprotein n=1 Tax=Halalkalibacter wakoensis JCM 9140 TaxID=1236970 RepID=W4Q2V2_9BACI|nr:hypothetical protein [Halalkalibacter wakoensis]GAE26280.1 hypothetical protein JCM9140_2329 [Halalkalibacter wakoensis JCM 9140]
MKVAKRGLVFVLILMFVAVIAACSDEETVEQEVIEEYPYVDQELTTQILEDGNVDDAIVHLMNEEYLLVTFVGNGELVEEDAEGLFDEYTPILKEKYPYHYVDLEVLQDNDVILEIQLFPNEE